MLFLGQLILFRPKNFFYFLFWCYQCLIGYTRIFFLVKRMCRVFLDSSETNFFFPYYPFFSKTLGPPFYLEALGNCLIGLVEGSTLSRVKQGQNPIMINLIAIHHSIPSNLKPQHNFTKTTLIFFLTNFLIDTIF